MRRTTDPCQRWPPFSVGTASASRDRTLVVGNCTSGRRGDDPSRPRVVPFVGARSGLPRPYSGNSCELMRPSVTDCDRTAPVASRTTNGDQWAPLAAGAMVTENGSSTET